MSRTSTRLPALLGAGLLLLACGSASGPAPGKPPVGEVLWPAPANPLELAVKAGLVPEKKETLVFHVHAHVDVFIDGKQVIVPAGIGINIQDPGVHKFDYAGTAAYGGIQGCSQPCISPLHTHDQSGVIHTESGRSTPNRLGQFLIEWNVPFSSACLGQECQPATPVAVYVNGKQSTGDPAAIELTDRKEIVIVLGAAPPHMPSVFPADAPA